MFDINELKKQFLEYLEIEKNRARKTVENYNHYLKRFFDYAKIKEPDEITQEIVRTYRLYLNRFESPSGALLKKQTQMFHLIALRNFLKYLAKRDIKTLASEKIELGKMPSREIEFMEEEELKRLLNSPKGNDLRALRDRALLETLFSTGLRVSELARLNRDSINLSAEGGSAPGGKIAEFGVRGKGGKIRIVFLSDDAKEKINQYLEKREDTDEALFIQIPKNKKFNKISDLRLTPRSVERLVKKYAVASGISKKVTPHSLRHSFATDLLRSGADLRSVQALLGHSNITTTQVYTHVTDKTLRDIHKKYHGKRR